MKLILIINFYINASNNWSSFNYNLNKRQQEYQEEEIINNKYTVEQLIEFNAFFSREKNQILVNIRTYMKQILNIANIYMKKLNFIGI